MAKTSQQSKEEPEAPSYELGSSKTGGRRRGLRAVAILAVQAALLVAAYHLLRIESLPGGEWPTILVRGVGGAVAGRVLFDLFRLYKGGQQ